jgi:hypothetical protein
MDKEFTLSCSDCESKCIIVYDITLEPPAICPFCGSISINEENSHILDGEDEDHN